MPAAGRPRRQGGRGSGREAEGRASGADRVEHVVEVRVNLSARLVSLGDQLARLDGVVHHEGPPLGRRRVHLRARIVLVLLNLADHHARVCPNDVARQVPHHHIPFWPLLRPRVRPHKRGDGVIVELRPPLQARCRPLQRRFPVPITGAEHAQQPRVAKPRGREGAAAAGVPLERLTQPRERLGVRFRELLHGAGGTHDGAEPVHVGCRTGLSSEPRAVADRGRIGRGGSLFFLPVYNLAARQNGVIYSVPSSLC